jgi:hypothetical protein
MSGRSSASGSVTDVVGRTRRESRLVTGGELTRARGAMSRLLKDARLGSAAVATLVPLHVEEEEGLLSLFEDPPPARLPRTSYVNKVTHCTLNTAHKGLHTAHYKLHTAHYTLHTTHCTLHSTQ